MIDDELIVMEVISEDVSKFYKNRFIKFCIRHIVFTSIMLELSTSNTDLFFVL